MNIEKNIMEQYQRILSIDDLDKFEELAFTTSSGYVLDTISRLRREYIKIDTVFTFDIGESLDFVSSKNIRSIIEELGRAIENIEKYNVESLQKIIVIVQMFLGIDISFYNVTNDLIKRNQLVENVVELSKNDFEKIYNKVITDGFYKKRWK